MIATIGIGSNLGDRLSNIRKAIEGFSAFGKTLAVSGVFLTKPWGFVDQPDFYNAVALVETDLNPRDLLKNLQALETGLGRVESGQKWGPRIIDLDILLFGDLCVNEAGLVIPHPHMEERLFVLAPLAEVDPSYRNHLNHPDFEGQAIERISDLEQLISGHA